MVAGFDSDTGTDWSDTVGFDFGIGIDRCRWARSISDIDLTREVGIVVAVNTAAAKTS